MTTTERRRRAAENRAFDEVTFADFPGEQASANGDDDLEDRVDLDDDDLRESETYDPIAEAVRLARYGMAVTPFVLTGRDKNPAFSGSWLQNATCKINEVVEDFEHAASKYGAQRVLVGWAIGRDGFCAMDDDHGLHESVAVVLDHPHGINETFRGRHIIFRNPEGITPANSTNRFPNADFGEFRGRGGCIIVGGADRPGFDPTELERAGPFPFPDWLTPANESAPAANDATVTKFLAEHTDDLGTDRLEHFIAKLNADPTASRHERLIKYAGLFMRNARAGIVPSETARSALWDWWTASGIEADYPRTWRTDFHRYIACAIGYANAETDQAIADRLDKAKRHIPRPSADRGELPIPKYFSDAEVGEAFGATLVGRWLHCRALGGWLMWDGKRWRRDVNEAVFEEARRYVLDVGKALFEAKASSDDIKAAARYRERAKIDAVVTIARRLAGIAAETADFDQHPDLLAVRNGVVDLRDGTIRPHDPALKITQYTNVDYRPHVRHADVDAVLATMTAGVRPWVQKLYGYAATGHVNEDVMPVKDGSGSNGKTSLLGGVSAALGEYARVADARLLMKSAHDEHPTLFADLRGRRLVTIEETAEGGSLRVEAMKMLTGGSTIAARFIRGDYFEFTPTHLLVIATNHRPAVNSTEHAAWRRLRLIPFPYRYEHPDKMRPGDRTIDPGLRDRLKHGRAQREAMLAWIIAGAIAWHRDGLGDCAEIRSATEAWRRSEDVILRFCHDRIKFDPDAVVSAQFVYDNFRAWCDLEGRPAASLKEFRKRFEEHDLYAENHVEFRRTMRGSDWFGLRISPAT